MPAEPDSICPAATTFGPAMIPRLTPSRIATAMFPRPAPSPMAVHPVARIARALSTAWTVFISSVSFICWRISAYSPA